MKLNKSQINYAMSRLMSKINDKRNKLPTATTNKTDPNKVYDYLESKSANALFGTRAEFIKNIDNDYYLRSFVQNTLMFDDSFDQEYNNYQRTLEEFDQKYKEIAENIEDQLNLCGDAEQALLLINNI